MAGAGNFTTLRIIVFRGNGPIGIPLVHKLQHMPKDVNSFFHFHPSEVGVSAHACAPEDILRS